MLTKTKKQPNFARVKVRMRITTILQEAVMYADEFDKVFDQSVDYELKPVLCMQCDMSGHDDNTCRKVNEPKQQWVPKQRQEMV